MGLVRLPLDFRSLRTRRVPPERAEDEAVRVKPNVQLQSEKFGEARKKDSLR